MPLRTKNGGADTVLREEFVGSATGRICYPGVSSCITITGVQPTGLVGAHITVISESTLIDEALVALKSGGGSSCINFYVVGAIAEFKAEANISFDKRKKIRDKIRELVNKHATVWFFDTSSRQEVHIFAELNGTAPAFSFVQASGNHVAGYTFPSVANRTNIASHQFQVR